MKKVYLIPKDYFSDVDPTGPRDLSDSQFADLAEAHGEIYTLEEFAKWWNLNLLDYDYKYFFIRFI